VNSSKRPARFVISPQGIYFESLVEQAFKRIKKPFTPVEPNVPNQPAHDILVEQSRISLKTETGAGTKRELISITKLCTTEKEPWTPSVLVQRVLEHLARYDIILMLRAVWEPPLIHYQLLEIPSELLRLIGQMALAPVGKRSGRQSIGGDVFRDGERLYHVHFDGADGKCQIRNLRTRFCEMLLEWDLQISL